MENENEEQIEKGAAVKFPPPILPIVTIIAGYVIGRFLPLFPDSVLPAPERYWIGGLICVAAVVVFVILPFKQFQRTGQDPKPWTPTPEFIGSGLYRFSRNPMYLGMIVFCLGFAVILSEAWIVILTPACGWLIYVLAIGPEEAYLEQRFGDAYREYKARVRRWI